MTKLFLCALAGSALLGLSACGNDTDDTTAADTSMATSDTYAVPESTDTTAAMSDASSDVTAGEGTADTTMGDTTDYSATDTDTATDDTAAQ